ncbi:Minor endoglucanase Y [Methylobacterium crusticola]|uniref:cellulase n=1 Tax=Methylobacterium crusticola TaxID=1697972 RepID=A0ABQ4QZL0_9HYPH|nr:glycosyl hydrolase family 8 [Methylobacterium crusticola]GJD50155.1 Minor endoglucanase Y [Methylobacterium crusticola]
MNRRPLARAAARRPGALSAGTLAAGALALLLAGASARAAPLSPGTPPEPAAAPKAAPDAAPRLAGALTDAGAWRAYRARFVSEAGRVVDSANGGISHSEGQGYGMLLAVAAGDRGTFERIWGWTRANLMVRGDALLAWRWEPDKRPAVADLNDASDGDVLVAWALVEAAEAWGDPGYRIAARRIAVDIGRRLVLFKTGKPPLLLPGLAGFSAEERADGPVVNLSYWVFPAFPRLALAAPEFDWARLTRSGLDLVLSARFGPARLPTEWISLKGDEPRPADGFPAQFSYNAIRIPLYLAWAGIGTPAHYAPFLALWGERERGGLPVVDVAEGRPVEWLEEGGYAALPALAACAAEGTPVPASFGAPQARENYYPATLHLLALAAAQMRYASCLGR